MTWVHKCIRNVPDELRAALVREAAKQGTNLRDVAGAILAEHYGLAYVKETPKAKTNPSRKVSDSTMIFRLPLDVSDAIDADAFRSRLQRAQVVIAILSDHFGLGGSNGLAPSAALARMTAGERVTVES